MVENIARTNFGGRGDFVQQKGIAEIHQSKIEINDQEIQGVEMIALEFKNDWVKGLVIYPIIVSNLHSLLTTFFMHVNNLGFKTGEIVRKDLE